MWDLFAVLLVSRLLSWRRLRCCFIASLININAAGFVIHGLLPHRSMTFLWSTRPRWAQKCFQTSAKPRGRASRKPPWKTSRKGSRIPRGFPKGLVAGFPEGFPRVLPEISPEKLPGRLRGKLAERNSRDSFESVKGTHFG